MTRWLAIFLLTAVSTAVQGQPSHLAQIQSPHVGMPAIVLPGGAFEVQAQPDAASGQPALRLEGPEGTSPLPLEVEWTTKGVHAVALCHIPAQATPGAYSLVMDVEPGGIRLNKAVFVVASFPDSYAVIHIAGPRIGETPDAVFAALLEEACAPLPEPPKPEAHAPKPALNPAPQEKAAAAPETETEQAPPEPPPAPAFVLVTGPLTAHGSEEEFQRVYALIEACPLPAYLSPGADGQAAYSAYFGEPVYAFTYGQDGYISTFTEASLGPDSGRIHEERRALIGARWSIGFGARPAALMPMREQLTLFIDDPLDAICTGAAPWKPNPDAPEEEQKPRLVGGAPWGKTLSIQTPAAGEGVLRRIIVRPYGIEAAEPASPKPPEPPAPPEPGKKKPIAKKKEKHS